MAVGAALGRGVYVSEDPSFAMLYIRDGRTELLFARLLMTSDVHDHNNGQQLVVKNTHQLLPCYIVHFTRTEQIPKESPIRIVWGAGGGLVNGVNGATVSSVLANRSESKKRQKRASSPQAPAALAHPASPRRPFVPAGLGALTPGLHRSIPPAGGFHSGAASTSPSGRRPGKSKTSQQKGRR